MAEPFAQAGPLEFMSSGCIVLHGASEVTLYPFRPGDNYKITIKISIEDDKNANKITTLDVDDLTVEIKRPWGTNASSFAFVPVALNDRYAYYLNGTTTLVGDKSAYILTILYSIYRVARQ